MTCSQFIDRLTDLLDGALGSETADYRHHLELCDGCRQFAEQVRRTIELLGSFAPSGFAIPVGL
jgi:hypothetical protein